MLRSCPFGLSVLLLFSLTASAEEAVVRLSWAQVPGASAYQVQIAQDEFFSALVVDVVIPRAGFDWHAFPTSIHHWRVRSLDDEGRTSRWSPARQVQGRLQIPRVRASAGDTDRGALVRWGNVLGAERYVIDVDGRRFRTKKTSWRVRKDRAGKVKVSVAAERGTEQGPRSKSVTVAIVDAPKAHFTKPTLSAQSGITPPFGGRPAVRRFMSSSTGRWEGPLTLAVSVATVSDFYSHVAPGASATIGWAAPFGLHDTSWELETFITGIGRNDDLLVHIAHVRLAARYRRHVRAWGLEWAAAVGPALVGSQTVLGSDIYYELHPALVGELSVGLPLPTGALVLGAGASAGTVTTHLSDVSAVCANFSLGYRFGGAQ